MKKVLFSIVLISLILCACLPLMTDLFLGQLVPLDVLFIAMAITSLLFLVNREIRPGFVFSRNVDRRDKLLECFRLGILNPKIYPTN